LIFSSVSFFFDSLLRSGDQEIKRSEDQEIRRSGGPKPLAAGIVSHNTKEQNSRNSTPGTLIDLIVSSSPIRDTVPSVSERANNLSELCWGFSRRPEPNMKDRRGRSRQERKIKTGEGDQDKRRRSRQEREIKTGEEDQDRRRRSRQERKIKTGERTDPSRRPSERRDRRTGSAREERNCSEETPHIDKDVECSETWRRSKRVVQEPSEGHDCGSERTERASALCEIGTKT